MLPLLLANGADVAARANDGSAEYSRRRCTICLRTPVGALAVAVITHAGAHTHTHTHAARTDGLALR